MIFDFGHQLHFSSCFWFQREKWQSCLHFTVWCITIIIQWCSSQIASEYQGHSFLAAAGQEAVIQVNDDETAFGDNESCLIFIWNKLCEIICQFVKCIKYSVPFLDHQSVTNLERFPKAKVQKDKEKTSPQARRHKLSFLFTPLAFNSLAFIYGTWHWWEEGSPVVPGGEDQRHDMGWNWKMSRIGIRKGAM